MMGDLGDISVAAGEYDVDTVAGDEQFVPVSSYKLHEAFEDFTLVNDICSIKVAEPLIFDGTT